MSLIKTRSIISGRRKEYTWYFSRSFIAGWKLHYAGHGAPKTQKPAVNLNKTTQENQSDRLIYDLTYCRSGPNEYLIFIVDTIYMEIQNFPPSSPRATPKLDIGLIQGAKQVLQHTSNSHVGRYITRIFAP